MYMQIIIVIVLTMTYLVVSYLGQIDTPIQYRSDPLIANKYKYTLGGPKPNLYVMTKPPV